MSMFDFGDRRSGPVWTGSQPSAREAGPVEARDSLGSIVAEICRERGIHEAKLSVAMYALAADARDETGYIEATPDDLALAEIVSSLVLEVPGARELAARAAFESATQVYADGRKRGLPADPEAAWLRQASASIKRALLHEAQRPEYHALAAQIFAAMLRHRKAVQHAELALADDPENLELLLLAGTCALEADYPKDAEAYLVRAHTVAPSSERVSEGLAAARRAIRVKEEIAAEASLWREPDKVVPLLQRAYEGDRTAMATIAHEYYEGGRVAQNPSMAYLWFSLLARFGDGKAKERLRSDPLLWGNKNEGVELVERWMRARRS